MRDKRLWDVLLGLRDAVVEDLELDEGGGQIIVHVRIGWQAGGDRKPNRTPPDSASASHAKTFTSNWYIIRTATSKDHARSTRIRVELLRRSRTESE